MTTRHLNVQEAAAAGVACLALLLGWVAHCRGSAAAEDSRAKAAAVESMAAAGRSGKEINDALNRWAGPYSDPVPPLPPTDADRRAGLAARRHSLAITLGGQIGTKSADIPAIVAACYPDDAKPAGQ